ncbi:hypothetical protein ABXZ88_003239 [Vibrio fluvialis]
MASQNNVDNYMAGAWTALAYMAETGADKSDVESVIVRMSLQISIADEDDLEILKDAYGEDFLTEF